MQAYLLLDESQWLGGGNTGAFAPGCPTYDEQNPNGVIVGRSGEQIIVHAADVPDNCASIIGTNWDDVIIAYQNFFPVVDIKNDDGDIIQIEPMKNTWV